MSSSGSELIDLNQTWKSNKPIQIAFRGETIPLTFSFDGEIPAKAWLPQVYANKKLLKTMRESILEKFGKNPTYPIESMAAYIDMTPSQFRMFGLRKDVSKNKKNIEITDLSPYAYDFFC